MDVHLRISIDTPSDSAALATGELALVLARLQRALDDVRKDLAEAPPERPRRVIVTVDSTAPAPEADWSRAVVSAPLPPAASLRPPSIPGLEPPTPMAVPEAPAPVPAGGDSPALRVPEAGAHTLFKVVASSPPEPVLPRAADSRVEVHRVWRRREYGEYGAETDTWSQDPGLRDRILVLADRVRVRDRLARLAGAEARHGYVAAFGRVADRTRSSGAAALAAARRMGHMVHMGAGRAAAIAHRQATRDWGMVPQSVAIIVVGVFAGYFLGGLPTPPSQTRTTVRSGTLTQATVAAEAFAPAGRPVAPAVAPAADAPAARRASSIEERPAAARSAPVPVEPAGPVVTLASVHSGTGRPSGEPQFAGSLLVQSEPSGAKVYVNQELVGVSPLLLPKMRARSYAIQVGIEGHELWSRGIQVVANRQTKVTAQLQPER